MFLSSFHGWWWRWWWWRYPSIAPFWCWLPSITCYLHCPTPNTCPHHLQLLLTLSTPLDTPETCWWMIFASPHNWWPCPLGLDRLVVLVFPLILPPFPSPLALSWLPNRGLSLVSAINVHVIQGWSSPLALVDFQTEDSPLSLLLTSMWSNGLGEGPASGCGWAVGCQQVGTDGVGTDGVGASGVGTNNVRADGVSTLAGWLSLVVWGHIGVGMVDPTFSLGPGFSLVTGLVEGANFIKSCLLLCFSMASRATCWDAKKSLGILCLSCSAKQLYMNLKTSHSNLAKKRPAFWVKKICFHHSVSQNTSIEYETLTKMCFMHGSTLARVPSLILLRMAS